MRRTCTFLTLIAGILAANPSLLEATPQFARTYRVDCSHCHSAPPRLNERGLRFLALGYRLDGESRSSTIPLAVWNTADLEWRHSTDLVKPAQYLIPEEWRSAPLSQSFRNNLAADKIELVYTDEYGSGLGKMPKTNFAPRLDGAYQLGDKYVLRGGYGLFYGAFENRGGNPSLGYNYPFQFTLLYQSPNDVAPNRLPDGSLVGLDARDRILLDPTNVNANGLSVRGVEFDYHTPRYHNYNLSLQSEVLPNHSVEVGYVGTKGRNLETFTGMNNVTKLLPPGTPPQPHVQFPSFARGSLLIRTVGVSDYNSLQMRFQRRYHRGLQFLMSYTLSEAMTNAGDSLSGGGVGGLRAPDVVGFDLRNDIGLSGFHTKHAFVVSGGYDLPGSGAVLGGWRTDWSCPCTADSPKRSTVP